MEPPRGKKLLLILVALLAFSCFSFAERNLNDTSSAFPLFEQVFSDLWKIEATKLLTTVFIAVVCYFTYEIFFKAYDIPATSRPIPTKGVEAINRSRLSGMPPCYPNGWYKILDSFELKKGEVKAINVLGSHLVAFRGQDGKVGVLDGYCPHLGTDLAVGSTVKDNCIECPFHGWLFRADGQCTTIPYTDTVPEVAHATAWQCKEINHMIYIYYHSERKPDPIFPVPYYPEMDNGWVYHGKIGHFVSAHIQELPENGADAAHLHHLHVPFLLDKLSPAIKHRWEAGWKAGEGEESHVGKMNLTHWLQFFGKDIPGTKVETKIDQVGPGVVFLTFFLPVGKLVIIGTVTPQGPLLQRYDHTVYAEKHIPRFLAKIVLWSLDTQLSRDLPIWNSKAFLSKPVIVKNDGMIPQFRRWFSQFYTKNEDGTIKKVEGMDW